MKIEIELKKATKQDFLEIDGYLPNGKKKWKLKPATPYWLLDSKGKVTNHPYILRTDSDMVNFKQCLDNELVLIAKDI